MFSQINIINYNLNPLFFLSSCCGCIVPYLSLCHCSLNHSVIGFLFGYRAFSGCSSLTEVRIPKGCYVHGYAFEDSPNVKIIRY